MKTLRPAKIPARRVIKFLILTLLVSSYEALAQWHDSGPDVRSAKEILCSGTGFWSSYNKMNLASFEIRESKQAYREVDAETTRYLHQNCSKITSGESPEAYASQLEYLNGADDNCKSNCTTSALKTGKEVFVAECRMVCAVNYEVNNAFVKGYFNASNSCGQQGKSPASPGRTGFQ